MSRIVRFLGSLRTTLGLLLAIGALLAVGLVVPQRQLLQTADLYADWKAGSPNLVAVLEAIGLTDVHRSPLALAIWSLFFVNLAVVMVRRLPGTLERVKLPATPPRIGPPSHSPPRRVAVRRGLDAAEVARALAHRRWAVVEGDGRLLAVRNRFAPLASIAFHLSFFLVALGGGTSYFTRFEGLVDLGEGEEFTGDLAQYAGPPLLPRFGGAPEVRFTVERIEPLMAGDTPLGVKVHLRDETLVRRVIEVNRPFGQGGANFVFRNLGVAPLLIVHDGGERELFGGWIRLDVLGGRRAGLQLAGLKLEAELFPDYFREGRTEGTRSQIMRDPVLRLATAGEGARRVAASLRPGEELAVGPLRVLFADWRWWVRLYVRAERGIGIVWAGFAVACLAAALRLLFHRRELVVELVPGGGALLVSGRAEFYRVLFEDELDGVVRGLEDDLGGEGPVEPQGGP